MAINCVTKIWGRYYNWPDLENKNKKSVGQFKKSRLFVLIIFKVSITVFVKSSFGTFYCFATKLEKLKKLFCFPRLFAFCLFVLELSVWFDVSSSLFNCLIINHFSFQCMATPWWRSFWALLVFIFISVFSSLDFCLFGLLFAPTNKPHH